MRPYQQRLALLLAQSGSLFFRQGLKLKDGRPTPYFVNLGAFRGGRLSWELGRAFADFLVEKNLVAGLDFILGPSYKGSALAQATCLALYKEHGLDIAFDYDRKEAKTHGEASGAGSLFVTGALAAGGRYVIIDDVATSMATKIELLDKVAGLRTDQPLTAAGVLLAVDRQQTQPVRDDQGNLVLGQKGADAVAAFTARTGLPVWPLLGIRQTVEYLLEQGAPVMIDGAMRPLDAEICQRLWDYLAVYGREATA